MTTAQLRALRTMRDNERAGEATVLDARTGNSLVRQRLAVSGPGAGEFWLTTRGRQWIDEHVRLTGDGPEDLKARFRFLGRQR